MSLSTTPVPSKPKFQPASTSKTTTKTIDNHKANGDNDDVSEDEKPKRVDRNRMALVYDSDDEKPNENLEKKLQRDIAEREKAKIKPTTRVSDKPNPTQKSEDKETSRTEKRTSEKFKDFLGDDQSKPNVSTATTVKTPKVLSSDANKLDRFSPIASTSSRKRSILEDRTPERSQESPLKKAKVSAPIKKETVYKPFGKLLDGVVLVISGIQNPDRGHIRDKALRMGAKYKPDWDTSCTHLMYVFKLIVMYFFDIDNFLF